MSKKQQTEFEKKQQLDKERISDDDQIKEIRGLLQQSDYAQILINALGPGGSVTEIEDTLASDSHFQKFSSYGDPKVAKYYASRIAGLSVIDDLLDSQNPKDPITDIGFNSNGFLTIETNSRKYSYGNKRGEPKIDADTIEALVMRMSQKDGVQGKAFTGTDPLFNGVDSKRHLRISATHQNNSPDNLTLSLRVSSNHLALNKTNFNDFAPMNTTLDVYWLLFFLVRNHANMILSAETGAGKTELQKLMIGFIPFQDRIVMVEDTPETHLSELYPKKDIYSWVTSMQPKITVTDLIKQSLRNNPKWLMVAETRGEEAYEMFQGVKSDHTIITTMHAVSNASVPSRFIGMAKMGYDLDEASTERDFLRYMDIGMHLTKKVVKGHVFRYLDEIAEFVPVDEQHPEGINVLFSQHLTSKGVREYWTGRPSQALQEKFYRENDVMLDEKHWPEIKGYDEAGNFIGMREQLFDMDQIFEHDRQLKLSEDQIRKEAAAKRLAEAKGRKGA